MSAARILALRQIPGICRNEPMAAKNEFRTLPPTLESFGVAIDFLSRFAPFTTAQLGPLSRAVRRQILQGEHVVASDGERINGYAGWIPTTKGAAEDWLAGDGVLQPVDEGADAAALTTVAVADQRFVRPLIRAARRLNPDLRVFFKRHYADGAKPSRKSTVRNREPDHAPSSPDGPAVAQRQPGRPPIAEDPCGVLFALAERAPGETQRLPVGNESVVVVQDPTIAAHVLVANGANYVKNFASFTPLLGASRLTLDGEQWRRSQRLTQSFIAPHDVPRAEAIVVEQYSGLVDSLLDGAATGAIADSAIDSAAVATILRLAFSADLMEFGEGFVADLRTVIRHCARRAWDLPGVPLATDEVETGRAQSANARIRDSVRSLVERRRADSRVIHDALSALMEGAELYAEAPEGQRIDLEGEIVTLIVAGSDTTSAAVGWALSILAEHSEFQEELRSEVLAVVGTRRPTLADAEMVLSLRPFLDETLRMFPPVPILSRFAKETDVLGNHKVAPGDRVLVSVIGVHQNPSVWDSPREFHLERHEQGAGSRPDRRRAFLPFGAGPRVCGGARFTQMEMSLALMLVLQRCRVELPAILPLAFEWGASLRRRGGQIIRATAL
jgi:cytochrome P450